MLNQLNMFTKLPINALVLIFDIRFGVKGNLGLTFVGRMQFWSKFGDEIPKLEGIFASGLAHPQEKTGDETSSFT